MAAAHLRRAELCEQLDPAGVNAPASFMPLSEPCRTRTRHRSAALRSASLVMRSIAYRRICVEHAARSASGPGRQPEADEETGMGIDPTRAGVGPPASSDGQDELGLGRRLWRARETCSCRFHGDVGHRASQGSSRVLVLFVVGPRRWPACACHRPCCSLFHASGGHVFLLSPGTRGAPGPTSRRSRFCVRARFPAWCSSAVRMGNGARRHGGDVDPQGRGEPGLSPAAGVSSVRGETPRNGMAKTCLNTSCPYRETPCQRRQGRAERVAAPPAQNTPFAFQ